MIPVFFNNQNYTTMNLNEAKDIILASTTANVNRTYLDCWRSVTPSTDKVKLEKWWINNHTQFKLKEETQGEKKELYHLVLTEEEREECEREIAAMEADLRIQECYYTQLELNLLSA